VEGPHQAEAEQGVEVVDEEKLQRTNDVDGAVDGVQKISIQQTQGGWLLVPTKATRKVLMQMAF